MPTPSFTRSTIDYNKVIPGAKHDMSQHIKNVFSECKQQNRPAFVAYFTLGYPTIPLAVQIIKTLADSGADIIELGVPFSDPMAEGPTIQYSNQIALDNGLIDLRDCLNIASQARELGVTVPLLFMGYYNSFRAYGTEHELIRDTHTAGVNGFIIVDLPPEESDVFRSVCREYRVSYIPLVAPTTTEKRLQHLITCADSFIYAVSLTGVTGERAQISNDLPQLISNVRKYTDLPVAIGFGISNNTQLTSVGKLGDGVIVGSAIIQQLKKSQSMTELSKFIHTLTGQSTPAQHTAPPAFTHVKQDTVEESKHDPHSDKLDAVYGFNGTFGRFGGRYVPETLYAALDELEAQYNAIKDDPVFHAEVKSYWTYINRPSHCHLAERLTEQCGGAKIYLKREDLNHTGAHKINNAIFQALLAKRLGKTRLIAETGAGQHGVATATIAAKLGLPLTVYMGAEDCERQSLNVFRMKLMGAEVIPVTSGSKTLKDAINEAMRDWVTNVRTTHYLIGSAIGPHPFPTLVRDFQSVIGREARQQMIEQTGRLPDYAIACVGGGSNAIGLFYPFKDDLSVKLIGVEAGGSGVTTDRHSATLAAGTPGVLHGTRTFLLQGLSGQINATHSISAGLDYPGVGPEHSHLQDIGRAQYVAVDDRGALDGVIQLSRSEGIIPALETAHAIKYACDLAKTLSSDKSILVCVSGRGDKDMNTIMAELPKYYSDVKIPLEHDVPPTDNSHAATVKATGTTAHDTHGVNQQAE